MILKIIEIVLPIIIIVLIGFYYSKKTNINADVINKINLDIFIPILVFYSIAKELPNISILGYFSLGAVIIVIGSGIILYPLIKLIKINIRSFLPTMMFNNSINLGLPLVLLTFGQEALSLFIALSMVQVIGQFTIAVFMYGGNFKFLDILKNPVIIATILGIIFNYFSIEFTPFIITTFDLLCGISIPLILFTLGIRLSTVKFDNLKIGFLGAILCPLSGLITAYIAITIFDYTSLQKNLLIIFGLLPPAVLNVILAEKYNRDSSMVASVVAIGNIFSILYIPFALYFMI
ncbi:AEC family transporter [Arcobacter sp. CECT 9188]|uniref:AEC family transporter n=1 Tax=Arcobacter sp. CECT 9188 TaxID=2044505 RepID=UPI000DEA7C9F|nr:AEC family transporter [Arcobacter sp. CECT 9188]RBQ27471.1 transporter [Arcobacter sp. CECT 9188]